MNSEPAPINRVINRGEAGVLGEKDAGVGERLDARFRRSSEKPPIRIVHLGLGAFHRAHQAWYTQQAGDGSQWGIAAFTGRKPDLARTLAEQDCLYTLVQRSDAGDEFTVMTSIVEAVDGADVSRLVELLSAESTAIVTLTLTEAAYYLGADGELAVNDPAIVSDIAALRGGANPQTPLGRLVAGLAARRDSQRASPLAIVCCDNLLANGVVTLKAVKGIAHAWNPALAEWIDSKVSFVSTSVDRITPRITAEDLASVQTACGYRDDSSVVTEPFHDWVLSGDFPAGRPQWEDAGALFVDEIEHYENRKLWLLNGAHSLLAYAGQLRGHTTVAEALGDQRCLQEVESFWDEASQHLPAEQLHVGPYREALLERFRNTRIAHNLAQIAQDGSTKLRMRALPVLTAERGCGRSGAAAALMLTAWMEFTRQITATPEYELQDPLAAEISEANSLDEDSRIHALVRILDPVLANDPDLLTLLGSQAESFRDQRS